MKPTDKRALGMLRRRSVWLPTWKGWLLILAVAGAAGYGMLKGIHPFLAVDAPVPATVMVVEGWIPMPALEAAAKRFRAGDYEMICTVGCLNAGEKPGSRRGDAIVVADQFLEMGIPQDQVHAVPSGYPDRDRTYTSASVLREWFEARGSLPDSLDVVTEGVHSRRSRLLFQSAFGDGVDVGVISLPDPDYPAARWWRYSEGVRSVLSEGVGYLYARFLFRPER